MERYILKTEHLTKTYKSFKALQDVTINLKEGKVYGLIGKNGAGKTTLMRIIAGLSFPTSGSVELFGHSSYSEYQKELRRIGTLIEYPTMELKLTAKDNLKIHRTMRGIPNDKLDQELLEMVGLKDVGKKKVKDFSLGMRQRLGIAIALLASPELLILDEPTNGLDPVGVVEIRNLIKKLSEERKITIIISSHNLPELYQTATDYIIIDNGILKQELTLEELEEKCQHYIRMECDEPEKLVNMIETKLNTEQYKVMPDKSIRLYDYMDDKKTVARTLFENGMILTEFSSQGETLENYFLSVIGGEPNV
jgi:ABC-2 type transport system ATP-binding protein